METNSVCTIDDCSKPISRPKYGWCEMHHARWRRNGDPTLCNRATVDETFFAQWSPEFSWLLGLIWSDGNLSNNRIDIVSKDEQIIETISELISLSRPPYIIHEKYHRARFSSPTVAARLRSIGLTERKSFTAAWPHELYFESDFVRGLIDGDGWVSIVPRKYSTGLQVGLCGATPAIRDGYINWLNTLGISYSLHNYINAWETAMWKVTISRISALEQLYKALYYDDTLPRLQRKYLIYKEWMERDESIFGAPRKWSDEEVAEAALRLRNGDVTLTQLKRECGISPETLRERLAQKNIDLSSLLPHTKKGRNHFNAKYTQSEIDRVAILFNNGESQRSIARITGISRTTVRHYLMHQGLLKDKGLQYGYIAV